MNSSEDTRTDSDSPPAKPEFPVAKFVDTSSATGMLRQSKMWWITLLCLFLAVWLAWSSMPKKGPQISIQFPEGHGLKVGDVVRYRGIEVGAATNVTLNEGLTGIRVDVMLKPGEGSLDREGTRFWIVRPRLSLNGVSGLETAVGAKYIGVSPGDPNGPHQKQFDGLQIAPPDELAGGGLELILRSADRHGISSGSPITWRGVDVGQVLSVNLSPDARHVDLGVRIDRAYRRLVRPASKFWITSGFGVDIGVTGVKVSAQSLTTIVRGGISFITPAGGNDSPINIGRVFTLAETPKPEWLKAADTVPFVDIDLPETVTVLGQRTTSILGIKRTREFTQTGILINSSTGTRLLTATLPTVTVDDSEDVVLRDFQIQQADGTSEKLSGISLANCSGGPTGTLSVPAGQLTAATSDSQFRTPVDLEECLVVRSAVVDGKAAPVIQAIDVDQIEDRGESWQVSGDVDFSQWHGAPVVSSKDGKIIGLVLTDSGSTIIIKYRSSSASE
jgi:paraquat-inducible protein B